ncbi:Glucose-6-phosphate isomerase [Georgfuchsia toluolica]|uniref:Glucose-6-phosphate isomerase n=1 Tax=Georgfuchsia toluolica TaxID=424218 RepID=A0A916N886_9PROT|nr:bifunctional transaldolase/phosoglucose isomerase [Georgfuchsia toluolica]CAG4882970.1 Glucose-6-phosphate isomerase [Georgfuchsia toluolica]
MSKLTTLDSDSQLRAQLPVQTLDLGNDLTQTLQEIVRDWTRQGTLDRLWARDAQVWTGGDEANWLDWLNAVARGREALPALSELGADLRRGGFTAALLIGMGGSSLGPEVLAKTLGAESGMLPLYIIDSTDPAQIASCEAALDIERTLFIVASKSGSTLEPDILLQYFLAKAKAALGPAAGRQFIAITDPGSKLEAFARNNSFRHIATGVPGIGGRYSVLSNFGLVPAVVMGINIEHLLTSADLMVRNCSAVTPPAQNLGVILGAVMGAAARAGRDKLTLLASPALLPFGAWVEQLVAESTGKHGLGIVPVDAEGIGMPAVYGSDRLFIDLRLEDDSDQARDQAIAALANAGNPMVTISIAAREQLAQEFFHWEMATAVAGAVLGIHPFDQPDVEAAKIQTKSLMAAYERDQILPQSPAVLVDGNLALFGAVVGNGASLESTLTKLFGQIRQGDYFVLLAYMEMNDPHMALLQSMRTLVRDKYKVATCLGFGPRFLHSTGQLYKGGPNSGVFLQITCDDDMDLPIPGRSYSFGTVKAAQALGDFQVLAERGRRALRVHVKGELETGLSVLHRTFIAALSRVDLTL